MLRLGPRDGYSVMRQQDARLASYPRRSAVRRCRQSSVAS